MDNRRGLVRRVLLFSVVLGIGLGSVELALHLAPGLLPASYRGRFAMHGVELFHPGILERTPVRSVPLPLVTRPHDGPPPADLKELGIAPLDEDYDARRYPRLRLPADAMGFPNPEVLDRAELLFIGDSFGVATGAVDPPGLQARLAAASGVSVYNLSVAGIGPLRELSLLERIGLEKSPHCVVWFFYAGNDTTDVLEPLAHEAAGRTNWAEAYADRRPPMLYLPNLLSRMLRGPTEEERGPNLPGFPFHVAGGSSQPVWFLPDNLRLISVSRELWEQVPELGWIAAREALLRAGELCRRASVPLLFVYLPTKEQIYLQRVEADPEVVLLTAQRGWPEPLAPDGPAFLERCRVNSSALEACFADFCEDEGIPWLSATPHLSALADRGELGFLATDTHWQEAGQAVLLAPLVDALIDLGAVDEARRIQ